MTGAARRLSSCPGFWTTWTAWTVSEFGSYVTTLAVQVLIVVRLDGSATDVGIVNAARWAPYLALGIVAGVVVDRMRRRPVLIGADLGRGLLLAAVPALAVTGHLQLAWLASVMAAFGLLSLFNDAAAQSFLPRLVTRDLLTAANARLDQSAAVAQTSGPALAGGLISLVGAPLAVLVDAVSYLVSGMLLWRVKAPEPTPPRTPVRGMPGEAADGLRWVYTHVTLRWLSTTTHAWFVCNAMAGAVLAPFALLTLGLAPFTLGLALAVGGCGALVGSLGAVRLGRRFGVGRVVVACKASAALAWAVIALAPTHQAGWFLLAAGQLVFGLGLGAENANSLAYRQAVTPDRLQGRMNATMRSVNRAMIVVGAPVGGMLADAFGYRVILWASAAGFLVVAIVLGASSFRNVCVAEGTECA